MELRKMEELKMKLMRDLETIGAKNPLTSTDIAMVDTVLHALKNLCKVMEYEEEGASHAGYSGRHYVRGHYSRDGYGGSYTEGEHSEGMHGRSYGEHHGTMRELLEREYSNARDERERDTIRRMMERM